MRASVLAVEYVAGGKRRGVERVGIVVRPNSCDVSAEVVARCSLCRNPIYSKTSDGVLLPVFVLFEELRGIKIEPKGIGDYSLGLLPGESGCLFSFSYKGLGG